MKLTGEIKISERSLERAREKAPEKILERLDAYVEKEYGHMDCAAASEIVMTGSYSRAVYNVLERTMETEWTISWVVEYEVMESW